MCGTILEGCASVYINDGTVDRNRQHCVMPRWCIGESVRIEPRYLQQNLVVAQLNITEYEHLLRRHGTVVQVLHGGLYSVNFIPENFNASQCVYTINEAGLRVVWEVGQHVRANARFYNAARKHMLLSAGVRVQDLYPLGNFDVTGIVQRDEGSRIYSVMMRLPSNNDDVEEHELHIDSYELNPVWNIGDSVRVISYMSANTRQRVQTQIPNTNIEEIRSWVCRIDSAADTINYKYNISLLPPGQANRVPFLVCGWNLRSSGPARVLEMDHTGAMSSSESDDFD
jgi:hypothetical protein